MIGSPKMLWKESESATYGSRRWPIARDGFKILDSDMYVFEPHDLYPEWLL